MRCDCCRRQTAYLIQKLQSPYITQRPTSRVVVKTHAITAKSFYKHEQRIHGYLLSGLRLWIAIQGKTVWTRPLTVWSPEHPSIFNFKVTRTSVKGFNITLVSRVSASRPLTNSYRLLTLMPRRYKKVMYGHYRVKHG